MFSPDDFPSISDLISEQGFELWWLGSVAKQYGLQAILVARCDLERGSARAQWAFNVPVGPFNGADNAIMLEALKECFRIHPKAHVHAMAKDRETLSGRVCRHNRSLQQQYRLWFIPLRVGDHYFVFLGFPLVGKGETMPKDLLGRLAPALTSLEARAEASAFMKRMQVTERFVKEVGHDLASATQAAVAKVRVIADGRVTGDGIRNKAKEVEQQIWDFYRISESLGIAMEPFYELRQPEDFDLCDAAKRVVRQFASEAAERHIRFRYDFPDRSIIAWGDKPAIEQALGQLISNAVKYSFGGNEVTVSASERRDDFFVRVSDKGIPLPESPDLEQIWDFGFRGSNAKEKHVNGSGIGLYSVKKIVTAHRGWVDARSANETTDFFIHLPSKVALKKQLGVLL